MLGGTSFYKFVPSNNTDLKLVDNYYSMINYCEVYNVLHL